MAEIVLRKSIAMNVINHERPIAEGSPAHKTLCDPFFFLPTVADALSESDVSCRLCSVKMISRTGMIAGLCPSCLEERCARCGDRILLDDGSLGAGLTVGRGGTWKCAKCSGRLTKRRAVERRR